MKAPRIIGIILIVVALVVGAVYGSKYYLEYSRRSGDNLLVVETDAKAEAEAARVEYIEMHPEVVDSSSNVTSDISDSTEQEKTDEEEDKFTEKIRLVDNDIVAKLTIKACDIETLVYENEVDDYYLHKDADGKYSTHGQIYTNCYNCEVPVIYGHHMTDGTMFASLDVAYVGAQITLEDIGYLEDEVRTYEIVTINKDVPASDVWDYLDSVEEGLVLITCSYGVKDGRLIIVAKEIDTAG